MRAIRSKTLIFETEKSSFEKNKGLDENGSESSREVRWCCIFFICRKSLVARTYTSNHKAKNLHTEIDATSEIRTTEHRRASPSIAEHRRPQAAVKNGSAVAR